MLKRVKKIGIFGGTFNPIHVGHIKMAEKALKRFKLDLIYFIPCGIPPHKSQKDLLPAKLRFEMVKKSIEKNEHFKISNIEIKKRKKSYTYDTVLALRKKMKSEHKAIELYFILGQDQFEKLDSWYKVDELVSMINFIVLKRGKKEKMPRVEGLVYFMLNTKQINISSEKIRKRIEKKQSIKRLVPKEIEKTFL